MHAHCTACAFTRLRLRLRIRPGYRACVCASKCGTYRDLVVSTWMWGLQHRFLWQVSAFLRIQSIRVRMCFLFEGSSIGFFDRRVPFFVYMSCVYVLVNTVTQTQTSTLQYNVRECTFVLECVWHTLSSRARVRCVCKWMMHRFLKGLCMSQHAYVLIWCVYIRICTRACVLMCVCRSSITTFYWLHAWMCVNQCVCMCLQ